MNDRRQNVLDLKMKRMGLTGPKLEKVVYFTVSMSSHPSYMYFHLFLLKPNLYAQVIKAAHMWRLLPLHRMRLATSCCSVFMIHLTVCGFIFREDTKIEMLCLRESQAFGEEEILMRSHRHCIYDGHCSTEKGGEAQKREE